MPCPIVAALARAVAQGNVRLDNEALHQLVHRAGFEEPDEIHELEQVEWERLGVKMIQAKRLVKALKAIQQSE
jgi:hypothetical protein